MQTHVRKVVLKKTASQDLGAAVLSATTAFAKDWALWAVLVHYDASSSETINVYRDSTDGANYDTLLKTDTLSGETDFAWFPEGVPFESGSELKVTSTANGSATAYLTIIGIEL